VCTLTWLCREGGYELFFNRDERRTRRPATEPSIDERGGMRFIAPRDGDQGGTWLSVNQAGIAVGVLNLYEEEVAAPPGDYVSRGLLVLSLADADSADEVLARLGREDPRSYQPFSLAVFEPEEPPRLARWTWRELTVAELGDRDRPFVSSAYDPAAVRQARRAELERLDQEGGALTAAALERFHGSHRPARGPFSPCMHRDDARTVSFSRVGVDEREARYSYCAGPPCRGRLSPLLVLPRVGEGARPGGGEAL
jgi:hypothetical protein